MTTEELIKTMCILLAALWIIAVALAIWVTVLAFELDRELRYQRRLRNQAPDRDANGRPYRERL